MPIRGLADLEALESEGFETVFPHRTPYDLIRASAERAPDAVAIRYVAETAEPQRVRTITYGEFLGLVHGAGNVFRKLGVGPEDAVALIAPHTASAQVALWGGQLAGRVCPINPALRVEHVAALIRASGAKVAMVLGVNGEVDIWDRLVPGLRAERIEIPILDCDADEKSVSAGSDGRFEDLLAAEAGRPLAFDIAGDEHAVAAYFHTGGTTGAPKLVRHARLNEAHVARSCALMHDLRPTDVVVNGFPLFHVAGSFVYGLSTLSAGGTLLIPGRLGSRNRAFFGRIWKEVERHRVTVLGAVPTMLAAYNGVPVDADISSLRALLTGGSPLPTELAEAAERMTGKPVRNILGMTECAGAIAVEPLHAPRVPLSCGFRLPFTEVAILGETDGATDVGKPLGPGQTGIIALRGPNVSAGYADTSQGRETFPGDGWLVSGDLGRLDSDGRLYVTGRKKDVIIRGGHNIDPQGIEDVLLAHPAVVDAAAVGMPDAYAGELPVAFVTVRGAPPPSPADLVAFLGPRIEEPAALPKRIEVLEAMPTTPIGKIFKPALRRMATEWAIRKVASDNGLADGHYRLDIDERLHVRLAVPETARAALAAALAGMPLQIEIATWDTSEP